MLEAVESTTQLSLHRKMKGEDSSSLLQMFCSRWCEFSFRLCCCYKKCSIVRLKQPQRITKHGIRSYPGCSRGVLNRKLEPWIATTKENTCGISCISSHPCICCSCLQGIGLSKLFHFFLLSETSKRADATATRGSADSHPRTSMPPLPTARDTEGEPVADAPAHTSGDAAVRQSSAHAMGWE